MFIQRVIIATQLSALCAQDEDIFSWNSPVEKDEAARIGWTREVQRLVLRMSGERKCMVLGCRRTISRLSPNNLRSPDMRVVHEINFRVW